MADQPTLRRLGVALGGVTLAVVMIAAGLVQAHSSGRLTFDDRPAAATGAAHVQASIRP